MKNFVNRSQIKWFGASNEEGVITGDIQTPKTVIGFQRSTGFSSTSTRKRVDDARLFNSTTLNQDKNLFNTNNRCILNTSQNSTR